MLKLTVAEDSLAEYSDTGTETSPKEMVAVPIERGGIATHIRCKSGARKERSRKTARNYLQGRRLLRWFRSLVLRPRIMHPAITLLTFE
jgi:hypothetical protein